MSRVLVLYGTTDGHTRKIAWAMGETLEAAGCLVDVLDAARAGRTVGADPYDGIIVAASLHARGYQRAVYRWLRRNVVALSRRPTAFVSVCLGVLEHDPATRHNLDAIIRNFQWTTGWQPDEVHITAGALPYTRYGWLKRRLMRRIAASAGGGTDTTRDYEYTDWDDLRLFAQEFAWTHGLARRPAATPVPLPVLAGATPLPQVRPRVMTRAPVLVAH